MDRAGQYLGYDVDAFVGPGDLRGLRGLTSQRSRGRDAHLLAVVGAVGDGRGG